MNVVFVEPWFPRNQREFARALAEAGATVIGIGEYPVGSFDDQLKGWLYHYEQVPSVTDVEAMTRAVRWVQDRLWVDRLEATIEAHIMPTAQVREACTIPGTSVHTPTQGVEAGYMANAYVRMRHPDYDVLHGMLDTVGRTLHVYAS